MAKRWQGPASATPNVAAGVGTNTAAPVGPIRVTQVEQGNFTATIAISPSLMAQYNFTPDTLQPIILEALSKRVNLQPTITVSVTKS